MNSGEKIIGRPELPSADAIGALALAQLIARMEAATGADRKLDTELAIATRHPGGDSYPQYPLGSFQPGYVQANLGRDGWSVGWTVPAYTASLDAALALVERVLPGWAADVTRFTSGEGKALLWQGAGHHEGFLCFRAKTPALALILAMLRALAALAETPG